MDGLNDTIATNPQFAAGIILVLALIVSYYMIWPLLTKKRKSRATDDDEDEDIETLISSINTASK